MLNLIKSDLYRITRPRGLRGSFWQYGIAIIVVYALITAMVMFANSPLYHEMAGVTRLSTRSPSSRTVTSRPCSPHARAGSRTLPARSYSRA